MIHRSQGSQLVQCATCKCWDVSYATDYHFRSMLRALAQIGVITGDIAPVQCSACSQHLVWHGRWDHDATRGMVRHPYGVLERPGWEPPTDPTSGRQALLAQWGLTP